MRTLWEGGAGGVRTGPKGQATGPQGQSSEDPKVGTVHGHCSDCGGLKHTGFGSCHRSIVIVQEGAFD